MRPPIAPACLRLACQMFPAGFFAMLAVSILIPAARAQQIVGAGATFPAPLYKAWAVAELPEAGISVDYQAIGSDGGQQEILNRTVDFGASDAPMDPALLASGDLLQVPTVIGAVVVVVNIPGVAMNRLQLPPGVLARIYLGQITSWADPAIAASNPGLAVPALPITAVHRADGSGTTFAWTSYLSAVDADWRRLIGAAMTVAWPGGLGARGNEGVAHCIDDTPGAIGYVESTYAMQNGLVTVQMQNRSGAFVSPSSAAFEAAAEAADWQPTKHFATSMIDLPGPRSWPVVSATYVLLPRHPNEMSQSLAVVKFLSWAYRQGNPIARRLHYVPLPPAIQAAALAAMQREVGGSD